MIQFRNARRRPRGKGGGENFLNKMAGVPGETYKAKGGGRAGGARDGGSGGRGVAPRHRSQRPSPTAAERFLSFLVRRDLGTRILGDGERGSHYLAGFEGLRSAMGNGNVFPPSASFSRHFCSCGGPQCLVQRARQKLKFTPHWPLVKISWAQISHFPGVYESCRISFRIWQIFKQKFCVRVQASWKWVRNPQI